VAAIDVAGYVADLKDHSVDHGFHVHDERHFVETYSLRQVWEVDLHPEEGCGGPLDLHLALDVDPRVLLSFEDAVVLLTEEEEPPDEFHFPLTFTWALPPLPSGPDLLRLAIDLAGVGGIELPLEVSAIDSFANATDGSERRLSIVARHPWPGCSAVKSSSAMCSTGPWPSAASSSSPPTVGSADVRRPRLVGRRSLIGLGATAVGAVLCLSACGQQSGESLARQACTHVDLSVRDYEQSTNVGVSASQAATLRTKASAELRAALPLAAAATSDDGNLNTLMTTISEGATVDEAHLVPALKGQCKTINTNVNVNPQSPGNLPGA
jgi:hypothetical protein